MKERLKDLVKDAKEDSESSDRLEKRAKTFSQSH